MRGVASDICDSDQETRRETNSLYDYEWISKLGLVAEWKKTQ